MKTIALALLLLLHACAGGATRAPSSAAELPWGITAAEVPEAQAITRWSDPRYEDKEAPAPADAPHVSVSCVSGAGLYPTHPQQFSKTYHVYRVANYDAFQVPAASPVCKIASRDKRYCQRADLFEHAVLSDIFQDACGTLYRAFWRVDFLKQEDNMGQLFSKGRTMYPKQGSEFAGDLEAGQTYALEAKDFLFLSTPFPGDEEKAGRLRKESENSHSYDPATHLFEKKR